MQNKNQLQAPKQSSSSLKSGTPEPWKPEEKKTLALALGKVFDLQKQFGKTTGQLENIVEGFIWVLSPYSAQSVIMALGEYMRRNSDMPTPSDLVKIIDPLPPVWKPDKSYYIKLQDIFKRDGPYGLNEDEIEYIQKYEDRMRKEMKEAR